jgi:Lrp/AsnC family transcriptional regulator for asnA, asnC and gidA
LRPDDRSKLKPLDAAIFAALQRHGRMPFSALADAVGVSEVHARRRYNELTAAGVFSVVAVMDPRVLGKEYMSWLGLVVEPYALDAVTELLVDSPEIDYIAVCSGRYILMAEAVCSSAGELSGLLDRLRRHSAVRLVESFVYLDLIKQQAEVGEDHESKRSRAFRPSELDRALLQELQTDGRASFRQIARRLGVSERVVSAQYRALVDQRQMRVIAIGHPPSLGYETLAWAAIELDGRVPVADVGRRLADVSRAWYVVAAAGRYDLMAELVCRDRQDLLDTVTGEIGRLGGVARVDTYVYLRLLYRTAAGVWSAGSSGRTQMDGRDAAQARLSENGDKPLEVARG